MYLMIMTGFVVQGHILQKRFSFFFLMYNHN